MNKTIKFSELQKENKPKGEIRLCDAFSKSQSKCSLKNTNPRMRGKFSPRYSTDLRIAIICLPLKHWA